jgi:hypothetical protein
VRTATRAPRSAAVKCRVAPETVSSTCWTFQAVASALAFAAPTVGVTPRSLAPRRTHGLGSPPSRRTSSGGPGGPRPPAAGRWATTPRTTSSANDLRASTRLHYAGLWRHYLAQPWADVPVDEVTSAAVRSWNAKPAGRRARGTDTGVPASARPPQHRRRRRGHRLQPGRWAGSEDPFTRSLIQELAGPPRSRAPKSPVHAGRQVRDADDVPVSRARRGRGRR